MTPAGDAPVPASSLQATISACSPILAPRLPDTTVRYLREVLTMGTAENKALARRYVEEVLNGGNVALLDELFAPDYQTHDRRDGEPTGLENVRQRIAGIRRIFPDFHLTLDDLLADDDKVVLRFTGGGTQMGELGGMPPTGKAVVWSGVGILRVAHGKFVELWQFEDQLSLLRQLGATITPPAVTAPPA